MASRLVRRCRGGGLTAPVTVPTIPESTDSVTYNLFEGTTPMAKAPPSRHTTPREASLASRVLSGAIKPTPAQSRSLAASVLSQDAPKKK